MGAAKSKGGESEVKELGLLTNFTPEELRKVYDDFSKKSPSGHMTRADFDAFYAKVFKADCDRRFLDHLFRTFDFNNDGQINFKEFVCGISVATRGTPDEKLTWTFNVYDVNHDGTITLDEVGEIMKAIYAVNGVSETEQEEFGKKAFQELDMNGDGKITVAEFLKGVKLNKRLVEMLENTVKTPST